jgi:hypothetical protein
LAIAASGDAIEKAQFHFLTVAIPTAQRAVIIQPRETPWVSITKDTSGLKGRDLSSVKKLKRPHGETSVSTAISCLLVNG